MAEAEGRLGGGRRIIVKVSTDKVDSEVPSSATGVIQEILVQEGETVSVGTAIAIVDRVARSSGDAGAEVEDQAEAKDEGEAPVAATSEDTADKDAGVAEQPAATAESKPDPEKSESSAGAQGAGDGDTSKRGTISPLVRRLADGTMFG